MPAGRADGRLAGGNKEGGNQYKHTPEEAARIIADYFASCEGVPLLDEQGQPMRDKWNNIAWKKAPTPYTVTGLALALSYYSHTALYNSIANLEKKEKPTEEEELLLDAYAGALARVRGYAEGRLFDRDGSNGAKFALAALHGIRDSVDINAQIQQKIVVSIDDSDDETAE